MISNVAILHNKVIEDVMDLALNCHLFSDVGDLTALCCTLVLTVS